MSDPTLPGTTVFGASETRHFEESGTRTHNLRVTSPLLYHSAMAAPNQPNTDQPKTKKFFEGLFKAVQLRNRALKRLHDGMADGGLYFPYCALGGLNFSAGREREG